MSLLVLFCCCYLCLRRQIQTNIAMIFGKKMFCPCFLLSFLWFPALACRSLIHFEFIFVCGVRKCSNFILLRVAVQFFYSSCFCVSTILSDFCSFVVQFEVRELCFFPQDCLAIWGLWWFYIKFLNYLFQFCKNCYEYFDEDCIKSIEFFGHNGHFNNINLPIQDGVSFIFWYHLHFALSVFYSFQSIGLSTPWLTIFLVILFLLM